jgi:hypothetical protein
MKNFVVIIVWVVMLIANAKAFDVTLLFNNKEIISRELSPQINSQVTNWLRNNSMNESELKALAIKALSSTFNEMEKLDTTCDLGLVKKLTDDAIHLNIIKDQSESFKFFSYLRKNDLIDDILYRLLKNSLTISQEFHAQSKRSPKRPLNLYTRQNAGFEYAKFYAPVKNWPDDKNKCSIDTYFSMIQKLTWKDVNDLDYQMQRLNFIAYLNKTIDLETYQKMEVFRTQSVIDWPIYFKRYADIINNSKDKLTKKPEVRAHNDFTVEYVSRKDKVTKRTNLYRTYNSTQIMMMAQIVERTAKRMDSRRVSLNWQYTDDPNGETEVYIFSPMEQYRAAIKMLRKDMAEVMRSDAFRGTGFEYSHLIAAAYEAGYIRSEELDYVVKFEDFWNPKTPKWQAFADFSFGLAGTATFYLPPPWNIIGAIALVFTQAKINGEPEPDPDDNWNVII